MPPYVTLEAALSVSGKALIHSFQNLCVFYNKEAEHTHRQYKFYCITIIQFLFF